ncbi:hypothetical protein, partial [Prevotella intermedia]|uniref:hypothetical protein n=1 Tax=Prevotella intermedia TaxID=28131 RepID=UPI001EE1B1A9
TADPQRRVCPYGSSATGKGQQPVIHATWQAESYAGCSFYPRKRTSASLRLHALSFSAALQ